MSRSQRVDGKARNAIAAPKMPVKQASKRRERTASTPTREESQVNRTTVNHTNAPPNNNVARRQCSNTA